MEAKYYTPEIEEFHVGFEYEYKSDTYMPVLDKTKGLWAKEIYSGSCLMDGESENDDIESLIKEKNIRVKHLDRKDVEKFGLKLKIWDNGSGYFTKDNYTFGIYSTGLFCTISQNDFGNNIMRFSGEIKNKSELKKLMKMLNIETK